jgi:hypothetical protein
MTLGDPESLHTYSPMPGVGMRKFCLLLAFLPRGGGPEAATEGTRVAVAPSV